MLHNIPLVSKYVIFCIIATFINLSIQRIFIFFLNLDYAYLFALIFGTMGGLLTKYLLDKHFIFFDMDNSFSNNKNKFTLYAFNGVLTTLIFWSSESLFYFYYQSNAARELGAVFGLSLGYILKYKLDKKFVFQQG